MKYKLSVYVVVLISLYMGISKALTLDKWFYDMSVFAVIILLLVLAYENRE